MLDFRIDTNIRLRSVCSDDAAELFALVDANRSYLRRWLSWVDETISEKDIRTFIQNSQDQVTNGRGPVCCVTHTGELVGICGFKPVDKRNRSVELGYWLAESFTGQGIMTQCVRVLIDYAFREMDINRIELRVATANKQSRSVAERLGFTHEGNLREAEWLNDRYLDQVVYSMLKRDWNSEQGAEGDAVKRASELGSLRK